MSRPADNDSSTAWSACMAAAQQGDARAYATVLRGVSRLVRALGRRRGLDPAAAEDLAQDVLLTLHRVRHTYDPARPFLPWLLAIAQRRMIDLYRRDGRIRASELSVPDLLETFADPATNSDLDVREMRDWLLREVATLPRRQREALELVKLGELSVAEASARSGQSEGSIKVNVHRAIRALRTRLGKA